MKRLIFRALCLENFREIEKLWVDLEKMGPGLHFVTGRNKVDERLGANGIGKSTIFADALCWVLTGKTTRGLRGPDIRPWGSKEHATVLLKLRVGKKDHEIERSTKNGLHLDGKLCDQQDIYDLIRLNDANLPYTLIFGQASPMFLDLTPTAKMALLSDTLRLSRFDHYTKLAKEHVAEFDDAILRKQTLIRSNCTSIDAGTVRLDDLRERAKNWQSVSDAALAEAQKELAKLEALAEEVEVERGKHDLAHDAAETEARAARRNHQDLMDNVSDLERKRGALEGKRNQAMVALQEIGESPDCPVCHRPMDKKHAKTEMRRLQKEADGLAAQIATITASIKSLDKRITRVSDSVHDFRKKADDAKDAHTRVESRLAQIRTDIGIRKSIVKKAEEQNPYTALIKQARADIDALRAKNTKLSSQIKGKQEQREHYAYWVDGFKLVRLYLLEEFLNEVEAVAMMMLPASGLDGWTMQFRMERELKSGETKIGLDVRCMKAGKEISPRWEAWSGGEGQRLRLVASRALAEALLRRAGVACDLMIFDEPSKGLSPEGVADMVDMLADCADDGAQIIYIDHQAVVSNRFASVSRIIKGASGIRIASGRT